MSNSQNGKKKLLISAAGTGGHVMPGLAVAREMIERGWQVEWIGTRTGMEGRLVGERSIPFEGLDFQGVRGKGLVGMVTGLIKLIKATYDARRIVREIAPDVLFTTGGYIAVPVCKAAAMSFSSTSGPRPVFTIITPSRMCCMVSAQMSRLVSSLSGQCRVMMSLTLSSPSIVAFFMPCGNWSELLLV